MQRHLGVASGCEVDCDRDIGCWLAGGGVLDQHADIDRASPQRRGGGEDRDLVIARAAGETHRAPVRAGDTRQEAAAQQQWSTARAHASFLACSCR